MSVTYIWVWKMSENCVATSMKYTTFPVDILIIDNLHFDQVRERMIILDIKMRGRDLSEPVDVVYMHVKPRVSSYAKKSSLIPVLAHIIQTFSLFKPAPQFHMWKDHRSSCSLLMLFVLIREVSKTWRSAVVEIVESLHQPITMLILPPILIL
jgi:hypothetical protein